MNESVSGTNTNITRADVSPMNIAADVKLKGYQVPSFKMAHAFENNIHNNFLIWAGGGLGDIVCAEPAIRYALETFKGRRISLATRSPELFEHLKFDEVINLKGVDLKASDAMIDVYLKQYLIFEPIVPPNHLLWEFMSHMLTHPVDFASICMWGRQLPIRYRHIKLPDFNLTDFPLVKNALDFDPVVVMHPGRHWPSKTFPKAWWDELIFEFQRAGWGVCLIGKTVNEKLGTVDVDATHCVDLREKLDLRGMITILKNCKYLFSNDSSPIHMAAAGDAFIGFAATCKSAELLTHWRHGEFGFKTKSFETDDIFNHVDLTPGQEQGVQIENLPKDAFTWLLPKPASVVNYYSNLRKSS